MKNNTIPESPPQVSIIIRTMNRPSSLRRAIKSVLAQSYKNYEIIVVNDGGEDVSSVISEFSPLSAIRYINHPKNQGRSKAANSGWREATGIYITFLDDDDILLPHHLETLVNHMQKNGNRVVYSDSCCVFYDIDPETGESRLREKKILFSSDFDRKRLLFENYIPNMCAMFEKKCIEEAGGFDENLQIYEDWDLWIRMSRKYDFTHIPICTSEYVIIGENTNIMLLPLAERIASKEKIYRKYEVDERFRLEYFEKNFEELERYIRSLEKHVGGLQNEQKERDKTAARHINNLEALLKDKASHINNLEALLKDKDSHINNLEALLKDKASHINSIMELVNIRAKEIESAREKIAGGEKQVRDLFSHTQNLEKLLKEKGKSLLDLEKRIDELDKHSKNLEKIVNHPVVKWIRATRKIISF